MKFKLYHNKQAYKYNKNAKLKICTVNDKVILDAADEVEARKLFTMYNKGCNIIYVTEINEGLKDTGESN